MPSVRMIAVDSFVSGATTGANTFEANHSG